MASTRRPPTAAALELFFTDGRRIPERCGANHQRSGLQLPGKTRGWRPFPPRKVPWDTARSSGKTRSLPRSRNRTAAPQAACRRAVPAYKKPADCSATLRPRGRSRSSGPRQAGKNGRVVDGHTNDAACRAGELHQATAPGGRIAKQGRQPLGRCVEALRIASQAGRIGIFRQQQQAIKRLAVGGRQRGTILNPLRTAQNPSPSSLKATPGAIAAAAPRGLPSARRPPRAHISQRPRPPPLADRCRRTEVLPALRPRKPRPCEDIRKVPGCIASSGSPSWPSTDSTEAREP